MSRPSSLRSVLPRPNADSPSGTSSADSPEALFQEAGAAAKALAARRPSPGRCPRRRTGGQCRDDRVDDASPGPPIHRTVAPIAAPQTAPLLAWVDYFGHLHIGNATTGAQSVVARSKADPTVPLVSLDGRLFWIGTGCSYASISKCPYSDFGGVIPSQVKEFDPATGTTVSLGRGDAVFAASHGRSIFVERSSPDCPATTPGPCDLNAEQVVQIRLTSWRSTSRLLGALRLVRQRR